MRTLKKITLALVLTLALSTGAMAGIVETPPAPEQSPPPSASATATGITDTPPAAQSEPTDPIVEIALAILQSVLF